MITIIPVPTVTSVQIEQMTNDFSGLVLANREKFPGEHVAEILRGEDSFAKQMFNHFSAVVRPYPDVIRGIKVDGINRYRTPQEVLLDLRAKGFNARISEEEDLIEWQPFFETMPRGEGESAEVVLFYMGGHVTSYTDLFRAYNRLRLIPDFCVLAQAFLDRPSFLGELIGEDEFVSLKWYNRQHVTTLDFSPKDLNVGGYDLPSYNGGRDRCGHSGWHAGSPSLHPLTERLWKEIQSAF